MPVITVVLTVIAALLLIALAVRLTDQGPMCGGFQMHPDEECVSSDGSVASYWDVSSSPLPSVIFALAVGLLGWLVIHVRNKRRATRSEINAFERYVTRRREELRTIYDTTPECQEAWATQDELIALFDKQVERVRRRKGFSASRKT